MTDQAVAHPGTTLSLTAICGSLFSCMLAYYVLARFVGVDYEGATQILSPQVQYFVFAVPIVIFGGFVAVLAFVNGTVRLPEWLLLFYLVAIVLVSVLRGDFIIIPSTIAFCVPIFGIWAFGLAPSPALLNTLLYFSIPLGALTYLIGMNGWGIIPGLAHDEIAWRVSIFPGVADTAFFCVPIILANLWFSNGVFRKATLYLAGYFLLFSVIRSSVIALILALAYLHLARKAAFRTSLRRWTIVFLMITAFLISIVLPAILVAILPTDLNIPVINQFLFHSETNVQGAQGLSDTMYRGWLWAQHISIFSHSPLFGIGSYDLNEYIDTRILGPDYDYSGSESLITGQLSRVGLITFFLIAAIVTKMHSAMREDEHAAVASGIVTIVLLFSHGGICNTYNVEFLILIAGMNWRTAKVSRVLGQDRKIPEAIR